jgi:hypothetical protein
LSILCKLFERQLLISKIFKENDCLLAT